MLENSSLAEVNLVLDIGYVNTVHTEGIENILSISSDSLKVNEKGMNESVVL